MEAPDDRPFAVKAYGWAAHIVSVSVGMVVPGLVGYWIDQKLGTKVLLTLLGFAAGMSYGIWQLTRIGRSSGSSFPGGSSDDSGSGDKGGS